MINFFSSIFKFFLGWFINLDNDTKIKVLSVIVEAFDQILRAFYKSSKNASSGASGNSAHAEGGV